MTGIITIETTGLNEAKDKILYLSILKIEEATPELREWFFSVTPEELSASSFTNWNNLEQYTGINKRIMEKRGRKFGECLAEIQEEVARLDELVLFNAEWNIRFLSVNNIIPNNKTFENIICVMESAAPVVQAGFIRVGGNYKYMKYKTCSLIKALECFFPSIQLPKRLCLQKKTWQIAKLYFVLKKFFPECLTFEAWFVPEVQECEF